MGETNDTEEEPRCRCGFRMGHAMIKRTPKYTMLGWITLLWGVSITPKRIDYQCMRCEMVIHTVDSEIELNREA